jgi:hypothetical protein
MYMSSSIDVMLSYLLNQHVTQSRTAFDLYFWYIVLDWLTDGCYSLLYGLFPQVNQLDE